MRITRLLTVAACLLVLGVAAAYADTVPDSVIVTRGEYQWVWAAPCPNSYPSCDDQTNGSVPLTLHDGFRVATEAEWLASFTGTVDLYNAFNGGATCGSAYFDSGWTNCDGLDVLDFGLVWNSPFFDHNYDYYAYYAETFLVRDAVPEPASLVLMGTGLLALARKLRKA